MNLNPTITRYPDEPHPNDEYAWKSWWVTKCFPPKQPLTARAIEWIHECWQTTKALRHVCMCGCESTADMVTGALNKAMP